ncbi:MAG: helicase HerA domain-containing protein [Phycisphaerales bacterium]
MKTTQIPIEALLQHIAVLGKTGSGKTFASKGIVEGLLDDQRQVCVIDPTSAWWGLRSSADGKSAGYPVLVLGGDHGDMPLPANSGSAVARLVTDQRVSVVVDTSLMTVGERTKWFTDFAQTLYRTIKAPLHLVIDEAHNFAPQGKVPDPDTGKMLHATNQLMSGGRSRGIRAILITQRPAKLHKDSLTCADTLIAMRVIAPQDRGAIEDWILGAADAKQGKQVVESLAMLKRGEGWVWFPEGQVLERITFPPIRTFDSSATPTDGSAASAPKRVAEIDLGEIRGALDDALKEAEANDPKALKARIAELEREAALKAKRVPAIEPAVLEAEIDRAVARRDDYWQGQLAMLRGEWMNLDQIRRQMAGAVEALSDVIKATDHKPAPPPPTSNGHVPPPRPAPRPAPSSSPQPRTAVAGGARERMLGALAMMERLGLDSLDRRNLAVLSDQSPKSSGYRDHVAALIKLGDIATTSAGRVALTTEGRQRAPASRAPGTLAELHDMWAAKLSKHQATMMRVLIRSGGKMTRERLAIDSGQSPKSSAYRDGLASMISLGVAETSGAGFVKAGAVLFPEGLR